MVYSTVRFVLCLALCCFVLVFSVLLALRLPRLVVRSGGRGGRVARGRERERERERERADLGFRAFVRFALILVLSVSTASWCLGRAAVCDCGTPWNFLLPFLLVECLRFLCCCFFNRPIQNNVHITNIKLCKCRSCIFN